MVDQTSHLRLRQFSHPLQTDHRNWTMWNERYNTPDYFCGTDPAAFLRREAHRLSAGQTAPVRGGWRGAKFGLSGRAGASRDGHGCVRRGRRQGPRACNCTGRFSGFSSGRYRQLELGCAPYDVVVDIFLQFAGPGLRDQIFNGMQHALGQGGLLLLHGNTSSQLSHDPGGPRLLENQYTADLLQDRFKDPDDVAEAVEECGGST